MESKKARADYLPVNLLSYSPLLVQGLGYSLDNK
jgi:hypothetical protein